MGVNYLNYFNILPLLVSVNKKVAIALSCHYNRSTRKYLGGPLNTVFDNKGP